MSRTCSICGKKPTIGSKRKLLIGHYNPMKKRWVYPNLQWAKNASGERIKICTSCLRTISAKKTKSNK